MAVPGKDDAEGWLNFLSVRHDAEIPVLEDLNRYYEGTQPLSYMHPEIFAEVGDRIKPVIIAWPQLVVDAIEERLDVEGFRQPDEDGDDTDLWRVWQANDMDEQSQLAHVDSLVMRRSYVSVGTNEEDRDTPLLAAESPLEMYAYIDPRTRKILAALRRVVVDDSFARETERSATLYLPNDTIFYGRNSSQWKEDDRDRHGLGEPPVVSLINRGRLTSTRTRDPNVLSRSRYGSSELAPILPLSDAANKIATDMMIAAEFLTTPVHGFFGLGPEDLVDQNGNKLTPYQALLRKFLLIPNGVDEGVKEFEFSGASLTGFHESINKLGQLVASLAGLPPHYLGFTTDNPASADAIRSSEARLVKRAERKQRPWGGSYERMCRLVRRFQSGEWDPKLKQLETRWRDASTPTVAQTADAAYKYYTPPAPGMRPILTLRAARELIGKSDAEIRRMDAEDEEADRRAAELDPVGVLADRIQPNDQPPRPEPADVVGA
ncbi:phage portal protein [Amycolatopsis rhabdoformis]|uniref:Phage portal protein n=1 Tax=Amycolatopsis rhabdoformis TaxID=1448059 RepID=A0ABZ1HXK9_9PSEU|nr:phage portal protein [Amycolatopsis rhabdoformis]WSE26119.1 phage portal protein [Amycolatopsis rhabdoformis]